MANLQIRVDDALKQQAQTVVQSMGIDLSGAVRIFLTQLVKENGFPFIPSNDLFLSRSNQEALVRSIEQVKSGNVVKKTLDELRSME